MPLKAGISPLCMKRWFRLFKHAVIRRLKYYLNIQIILELYSQWKSTQITT